MIQQHLQKIQTLSTRKAILTLVTPTILAMLVQIVYNLVDSYFVGQIGESGPMAAVGITMPCIILVTAIAGIPGLGAASMISRYLGANRPKDAKNIAACGFYATIVLFGVMLTALLLGKNALLTLCGADAQSFDYADRYLSILLYGLLPIMLTHYVSFAIRSQGQPKIALIGMALGTVTNIILDPILIFGCGMGVEGAAAATAFSNYLALFFFIVYLIRTEKAASLRVTACRETAPKDVIQMLEIGIATSLSQLVMSAAIAIANKLASGYGVNTVAAMGLVFRITTVAIFIFMGFGTGVQPLIGFLHGSGQYDRLKKTIRTSANMVVVLGFVIMGVFVLFRAGQIRLFIDHAPIIDVGEDILFAYALSIPFLALNFLLLSAFQAIGKPKEALISSLLRQAILYIPLMFVLNAVFGFGGFIYAQLGADVITAGVSLLLYLRIGKAFRVDELESVET